MSRQLLHELSTSTAYPLVTVVIPTHRTFPDSKADPIQFKNAVTEVRNRLTDEFNRRTAKSYTERLEALAAGVDFNHLTDGLAFYVGGEEESAIDEVFFLPETPERMVSIGESFAVRTLTKALNRSSRYWLIALSESPTRLFEGERTDLMEIEGHGFPTIMEGPGGTEGLPRGYGKDPSAHLDERHRQFFRRIASSFAPLLQEDPLPVVVAGVDRYHSFLSEVDPGLDQHIVGRLTGNFDTTPAHELGDRAWDLVSDTLARIRDEAAERATSALSRGQATTGLDDVYQSAISGRVETLIAREGLSVPCRLINEHLIPIGADEDPHAPDVIDDAIDLIASAVIAKGGRVFFAGPLEGTDGVVAITRF